MHFCTCSRNAPGLKRHTEQHFDFSLSPQHLWSLWHSIEVLRCLNLDGRICCNCLHDKSQLLFFFSSLLVFFFLLWVRLARCQFLDRLVRNLSSAIELLYVCNNASWAIGEIANAGDKEVRCDNDIIRYELPSTREGKCPGSSDSASLPTSATAGRQGRVLLSLAPICACLWI